MSRDESARDAVPEAIARGPVELLFFVATVITVAFVTLWLQLDVNRVFDVPKAVALKIGGCGVFLLWIVYGLAGRGYAWRSVRLFAAPVFALTVAVTLSTVLSIDVTTSFYGVYERQFGLQGFLGCVGIFMVTATCLKSRRGALLGLGCLAMVGSILGTYALLQSTGQDPYPFFKEENLKVYSFLGNATFAGNALALIFPITALLAVVACATCASRERFESGPLVPLSYVAVGAAIVLALQLVPGAWASSTTMVSSQKETLYKAGAGLSVAFVLFTAGLGTWGPTWLRSASTSGRRVADALASGGLVAAAVGILIGLLCTRTRGAWVGTGVAVSLGLALLPRLFSDRPTVMRRIQLASWLALGSLAAAMTVYLAFAETLCGAKDPKSRCLTWAKTIRSIPAAFDPSRIDYGKGQGTRRFLWSESPRVLFDHEKTLQRLYQDRKDLAETVTPGSLGELELEVQPALTPEQQKFDTAWRTLAVWPFGLGIETYRYAFMSHKSKRLEALDPMTNHDNPHNNYLYTLASFGIFGLAAYLWLLWRLLSESFRRFARRPRKIIERNEAGELVPGIATVWRKEETKTGSPRILLTTSEPEAVVDAIHRAGIGAATLTKGDQVSVTDYDDARVFEQLTEIGVGTAQGRADRAIAFGVVTSFFGYAVYSIAGFDSVACSVFLYFLLGCAAVYFEPNGEAPRRLLGENVLRQWAAFRKRDPETVSASTAKWVGLSLGAAAGVLLLLSISAAYRVYSAERAFVGELVRVRETQEASLARKIQNIEEAIRIHPSESFYKQNLGNTYGELARHHRARAAQLQQQGQDASARAALVSAQKYAKRGEVALYAALDHAWAPENIFISLFQLYYSNRNVVASEAALERALEHSPHLGAVRANLAVLELERGALDEALVDCRWVLEVDPRSTIALRTCGRALFEQGHVDEASVLLERAAKIAPQDRVIQQYLADLKAKQAATSTGG